MTQFKNIRFKITAASPVSQSAKALRLEPMGRGYVFDFKPGQYVEIGFAGDAVVKTGEQAKNFSISSSPSTKEYLEIVVINFGRFRQALFNAPVGTELNIAGPHGNFVYEEGSGSPVFIAGGSGIAPIMSMIRHIRAKTPEKETTLIYSFKSVKDIIFYNELRELAECAQNMRIVFIETRLSNSSIALRAGSIQWESERLNEKLIKQIVKEPALMNYYICGPYEMTIMTGYILNNLGVPGSGINTDLW